MLESRKIIEMNIAHYEGLLRLRRFSDRYADIEVLLAEAKVALATAMPLGENTTPVA